MKIWFCWICRKTFPSIKLLVEHEDEVTCEDCGSHEGRMTVCPYAEELSNGKEIIPVVLCEKCEGERAMDI